MSERSERRGGAVLPYGRQTIDDDDVAAVTRVLRSDFLTTGPEVDAFEAELAAAGGARFAIAVSNGTAALHAAFAAAGLGPGDEVILPPLTFCATANMVIALGAQPVFADVEPGTLTLDPDAVERKLTARTRAIVAVDFAGHPAEMNALRDIADQNGLLLFADAAHSVGSRYCGRPVGSLADLTTFSFHPVKNMTTGEGGAVLTDDEALAARVRAFRNHGIVRDPAQLVRFDGPWFYEVESLGFNYRLTAIQAALGRSQLRKLDGFVRRRAELVESYRTLLAGAPLQLPVQRAWAEPAWHLFPIRVEPGLRRAVFEGLVAQGILPQVHYTCVNDLAMYRRLGADPDETPVALNASRSLLSLPLFPSLTEADVARVAAAVRGALS